MYSISDAATAAQVAQLMQKSWDLKQTLKVTKVQCVENPVAYCRYMRLMKNLYELVTTGGITPLSSTKETEVHTATLGLDELNKECQREVNEYLFFHGTSSPDIANAIVAQRMECRLANPGLFGKGIYLAEFASKSHQYTGIIILTCTNKSASMIYQRNN